MEETSKFKMYTIDEILAMPDDGTCKQTNVTKGHWWIENTYADENDWHLTNNFDDEGDYSFKIKSQFDIIKALEHIGDKCWVDRARLLEGLMPAIRYFSYLRP